MKRASTLKLLLVSTLAICTLAGCGQSEESSADAEQAAQEIVDALTTSEDTYEYMDHSEYYDENGFFTPITATDYVTLYDFKSEVLPAEITTVSESDVASQISELMVNFAENVPIEDVNYAIQDGDTVNIDYVGSVGGVEFEGGSTSGYGTQVTVGVTQYIDGFLEQLVGHRVGENFDINVTFPEIYSQNTDLQNQDAVFNITINEIYESTIPELTDEFVAENFSEYYDSAAAVMEAAYDQVLDSQIVYYIWPIILENTYIEEIPTEYSDYYYATYENEILAALSSYGITAEEYLADYGITTIAELYDMEESSHIETMQNTILNQAIAETEGITVTDDDITTYFRSYYGVTDWSSYAELYGENYIKSIVLNDVVTRYVVDYFN